MAVRGITFPVLVLFSICFAACGPALTEQSAREQLAIFASQAKEGTSDQAVALGEKSLKMMDLKFQANQIIAQGEENFIFTAFDESLEIFETALSLNPNNEKALAYLAVLSPMKWLKGIHWRTETLRKEDEGDYWLNSFDPKRRDLNSTLDNFFGMENPPRLISQRQAQELVAKPLAQELLTSSKIFTRLAHIPQLDVTLHLPKAMADRESFRIRQADAVTLEKAAVGLSLFARAYAMYSQTSIPTRKRFDSDDERFRNFLLDPQFGLLQDHEFYREVTQNIFDFADGLELIANLLEKRTRDNDVGFDDFFQASYEKQYSCDLALGCHIAPKEQLYFTLSGSDRRHLFWADNGDPIPPNKNSNIFVDMAGSDFKMSRFAKFAKDLREMFTGPYYASLECFIDSPYGMRNAPFKAWINIPHYLQNPVTDIRQIINKDFILKKSKKIVSDKTIFGLLPDGIPDYCLQH